MFISDIEDQIRTPEGKRLLALYREAAQGGCLPHIRILTSDLMRDIGRDLTVVERSAVGEFAYVYVGESVKRLTGEDLTGKTTAHQSPKSGTQARRTFLRVLDALAPVFTIDRVAENSRVHLWGRLHLPMQDADGRTLIVTHQRPREYSDELLRDILDAAADGILAIKAIRNERNEAIDGVILAANAPMLEILRLEQDQLFAKSLLELFPDIRSEGIWDKHRDVLETRQCQSFETQISIAGIAHWYRVVSTPMGDGLVISFTDITELKLLNIELEHQRQRLTEEMAQRALVEQELWNLAHLDPLTGVANRRSMQEHALSTLAFARKRSVHCAMIAMDIDHFKVVNDTYGHAAGDAAIRTVANAARQGIRGERDLVARTGGEEFAMLLYDTGLDTAMAIAERLRREIETIPVTSGAHVFNVTVSFGVSVSTETSQYEDLLATADQALYRAKRAGRNRTMSEDMPEAA